MIDCASLAFSANVADKSLQVCVSHPLSHAMPYPTHLPQTEYDEKKPACREEAHSGLAQGQTSLIEEHHGFPQRLGWDFPDAKKCRLHRQIFMMWHAGLRGGASIWSWVVWILWHDQLMNVGMMAWRYCFGPDTWIGTMGRSRTTWHQKQTAKCHCAGDRWQLSFPSTFLQHGEDMKS